jgi:hypothetical protein|uniref:hypothetical protein n=1 Tax=Gemmiger formicilis TaxID=745368 RepID=UPI004029AAC4
MADTNIKTQISRLSGAKSDLATAITAKGVTVPDDTTLDGYAALVEQIDTGVDTSDATATAKDIAKGKTAYVQGQKITGKLYEYTKGKTKNYFTTGSENVTFERDSNRDLINITIPWMGNDEIMRIDSYIKLGADATLFGDATAADVISGKTFTSKAGLKLTGTNTNDADTSDATATADDIAKGKTAYVQGQKITGTVEPAESNNNVEAYAITNTNPSVSFKRTDGAIKIWGYGTMTSSGGWGQQTTSLVAFEGDKYHKGAIYGSPSSTSLSLSISNGKLTGLPSGLTAINAIVTRGI